MKRNRLIALVFLLSAAILPSALSASPAGAPFLAASSPERPDVRRVNDDNVRLRADASTSSAILGTFMKGDSFMVLETGKKTQTIEGKSGAWLKVRGEGDTTGYMFSPYLSKPVDGRFRSADFPSEDKYAAYLRLALRRGERVRAVTDYEKVKSGDLGWYSSTTDGEPPFLVVWDGDLEATPSDDAIDGELPRILEDRIYFVYASAIEIAGQAEVVDFSALALDWARQRIDEFVPGAGVSLGRHLLVSGEEGTDNWAEDMGEYVGEIATITSVEGDDSDGRPVVHVDLDDGTYVWRIENMRLETQAGEATASEDYGDDFADGDGSGYDEAAVTEDGYGMVEVGSMVVLGRHDEVNGSENWTEDMDQYVGKAVKVTELAGSDDSGCVGVRVDGNSYFWRVRNLALQGRGEAGGYGYVVGDTVILGRHREVNGDSNWAEEMGDWVGKEAVITELIGPESGDGACYLVTVDVDGGDWCWRVETLEPVR